MKTQTFAIFPLLPFLFENPTSGSGYTIRRGVSRLIKAYHQRCLVDDYKEKRMNGTVADEPKGKELPRDGKYTWLKGKVEGGWVFGVNKNKNGDYEYEFRYDAGLGDLAWFEEMDRNYLTRILKEGKLRELEPAVWYWWHEEGGPATDIADWWSQKLKLPNLDNQLKRTTVVEKWLRECGPLVYLTLRQGVLQSDSVLSKFPIEILDHICRYVFPFMQFDNIVHKTASMLTNGHARFLGNTGSPDICDEICHSFLPSSDQQAQTSQSSGTSSWAAGFMSPQKPQPSTPPMDDTHESTSNAALT